MSYPANFRYTREHEWISVEGAIGSSPSGLISAGYSYGNYASRSEQFASFQTDAPSCDNCGAITVRNGNCYLCHNCGNSMGCS